MISWSALLLVKMNLSTVHYAGLKRSMNDRVFLKEVKKRAFFTKPSVKKRMKQAKAIRRTIRAASEEL